MLQQIISLIITGILAVYVIVSEYKYDKVKACVMGAGFFTVAFLLDSIFWLIMTGFAKDSGDDIIQVIGIFASKSILAAGLIFLKVSVNSKQVEKRVGSDCWKYTDVLTIAASVFFVMLAVTFQIGNASIAHRIVFLLALMTFFVVYLISVYVHERKQHDKRIQAENARKQLEADIYLESVENNYQRTRELWHDLKNHINLMQVLLHEQKYDELNDYLRIFSEDVDTLTLPMKSGNIVVDALLSDKLGRAKREGVAVNLTLCDLTGLKLKADEICGLFGNLLDNALEANRQVSDGKFVEVTCKEQEECYYIRVRNSCVMAMCGGKSDMLKTAKLDKKNQVGHGLGLRSIERIVHGCGGEFVVENKGDVFTAVVRLPR